MAPSFSNDALILKIARPGSAVLVVAQTQSAAAASRAAWLQLSNVSVSSRSGGRRAQRVPRASRPLSHTRQRRASRTTRVCVCPCVSTSTRGWSCQHPSKSRWLSRPCCSCSSSCPGWLASAGGPGRRKLGLTLATPEKVGKVTLVAEGRGGRPPSATWLLGARSYSVFHELVSPLGAGFPKHRSAPGDHMHRRVHLMRGAI